MVQVVLLASHIPENYDLSGASRIPEQHGPGTGVGRHPIFKSSMVRYWGLASIFKKIMI
jgi:hypothetical protein